MADDADLDKFLSQVDTIKSIVKELADTKDSPDNALQRADDFLRKQLDVKPTQNKKYPPRDNTGVNRTVINHAAFKDDTPGAPPVTENMDQEAFMRVMEHDSRARGEKRRKDREEASRIKDEGNAAFKAGDYEQAVDLYSKALAVVKDLQALWTNRAQAYIKLGRYEEALSDCDWALRVDEKCLKAYIHRGRAYLAQGKYDDAVTAYNEALSIDPSKEKAVKGYLEEVERTREATDQEETAKAFVEGGDGAATGLVDLIHRVCKEDQRALYYSGGLRVIAQTLTDDTSRTLFRTEGGLDLTNTHPYIQKCWSSKPWSVSQEEADMLTSLLETYRAALSNNDENQRRLFSAADFPSGLLCWLSASSVKTECVRDAGLRLVYAVSQTDYGQRTVIDNTHTDRLVDVLMTLVKVKGHAALLAANTFTNLVLQTPLQVQLRPRVEEGVVSPCLYVVGESTSPPGVVTSCLDALTNLTSDRGCRARTAAQTDVWDACSQILTRHTSAVTPGSDGEQVVHALLGLVLRLTSDLNDQPAVTEALRGASVQQVAVASVRLLACGVSGVVSRAAGVLSQLLPPGGPAVTAACEAGVVPALVNNIKDGETVTQKSAIKALTACTRHNTDAPQALLQVTGGLSAVVGLLTCEDEVVVGNAALCLSHMTTEPRVAARLTKTNIIQHLLVKARDGRKPQLQHNAAILIAKLAQADTRHLERLRELHGLEILHDVLKVVQS